MEMDLETLPIPARIELFRQKQREGTLTLDEAREAISLLRANRMGAAAPSKSSSGARKKVSAPSIDVDDLI